MPGPKADSFELFLAAAPFASLVFRHSTDTSVRQDVHVHAEKSTFKSWKRSFAVVSKSASKPPQKYKRQQERSSTRTEPFVHFYINEVFQKQRSS